MQYQGDAALKTSGKVAQNSDLTCVALVGTFGAACYLLITFTAQAFSSAVPVCGSIALMVKTLVGT